MFSPGKPSITLNELLEITTEAEIAAKYLNIDSIPCVIKSPLRPDNNPSFGVYSPDGKKVKYIDFATKESGSIFDLLCTIWNKDFNDTIINIYNNTDISHNIKIENKTKKSAVIHNSPVDMKCKIRNWEDWDIEYWKSYGISLEWLKYANIYPISHKIIIKDGKRHVFGADKYAYAFVEFKEGKTSLKIYQPFNTRGFKWANCHDKTVISLWTKIPKTGDKVCICASLKDALCLWANTGVPALALQGEGYPISSTAINELKSRYNKIYILFDNDKAGLEDAEKLAKETGFINIVLPVEYGEKDVSDYYKSLQDKKSFKNNLLNLFI
jgi:hypothetical protein